MRADVLLEVTRLLEGVRAEAALVGPLVGRLSHDSLVLDAVLGRLLHQPRVRDYYRLLNDNKHVLCSATNLRVKANSIKDSHRSRNLRPITWKNMQRQGWPHGYPVKNIPSWWLLLGKYIFLIIFSCVSNGFWAVHNFHGKLTICRLFNQSDRQPGCQDWWDPLCNSTALLQAWLCSICIRSPDSHFICSN